MSRLRWICLFFAGTLGWLNSFGQNSGVIEGAVMDPQGAAIVSARVTCVDEDKNVIVRQATSGKDGGFQLRPLLPGKYTVKAENAGFKTYERRGLVLDANQILDMGELTLQIGSVTESVAVQAETPLVETATGQKSYVISQKQVTELSTNGRDFSSLMFTLPGVSSTLSSDFILGFNQTNSFSVNGSRTSMNNVYLDGNVNTDQGDNNSQYTQLSLDAVGEFKVQTSAFNAEYGRNAGVLISAVTKSGGNEFHGSLYEFFRNDFLDANSYFRNLQGLPRAELRFNQFGGNVGGPIPVLGRSGNRKLFFFFNYEGTRGIRPNGPAFVDVPNAASLTGDFASFLQGKAISTAPQFDLGTVFAPGTITRNSAGQITGGKSIGGCTTTFPVSAPGCNLLPQSNFDKNAAAFLRILNEAPRSQGTATPGAFGLVRVPLNDTYRLNKDQEVARVDYIINPSTTFFFRWVNDSQNEQEKLGEFTTTPYPVYPMYRKKPGSSWSWNLIKVISPTMTNEFIFGYDHQTQLVDVAPGTDPATYDRDKLGFTFNQLYSGSNLRNRFPAFNCAVGSCNFSAFSSGWFNQGRDFAVTDNFTKSHGAHTLKTGILFNLDNKQQNPSWTDVPTLSFAPSQFSPSETNNGLANLLLGNYTDYSQSNGHFVPNFRFTGVEFYGQDSWKASRKLTLEFGARYVYLGPTYTYGKLLMYYFDPAAYNPAQAVTFDTGNTITRGSITGGNFSNGMVQEGAAGYPLGFADHRKNQVAPRFSFAYDPFGDGKTAIRAGAGVFYERIRQNVNSFDGSGNPPLLYTPHLPPGNLESVPSASTGLRFPVDARGIDRNGKLPTIYSWSFGIQRQLGVKNALEVSYVGNSAHHLQLPRNINQLPLGSTTSATTCPAGTSSSFSSPCNPLPNFNNLNNAVKPFLGYGNIFFTGYDANSSYNSLQMRLSRRFATSFTGNVDYTWSKAIDQADTDDASGLSACGYAFNCAREKGPSGFDRTHILSFDYVYQLPKLGSRTNNALGRIVLDGWQISGITRFWSGLPLNVTSSTGNPGTLGGGVRPDLCNCGQPLYPATQNRLEWFNPLAFSFPANGTLGNAGRNILRGPRVDNWNLSLFKNTRISERVNTQLRLEAFNVFNHTQFLGVSTTLPLGQNPSTPVTAASAGTVGQITSARDPRNVQLGLKVYF